MFVVELPSISDVDHSVTIVFRYRGIRRHRYSELAVEMRWLAEAD